MQFYEQTFGWKFSKWDGPQEYWLISTGEGTGIDGGMMTREGPCTNTIDVVNIDESLKTIQANGGQLAVPKMAIPGVGHLAYCTDPEGTLFGVIQADSAAA
jgi:predicted enzyme related to lactoylglutathione lyase